jgi:hypothetical protein
VTGLGGFLRVFWNHLPAGWGGEGPFRAQSIKFVSRSPRLGPTRRPVRTSVPRGTPAKRLYRWRAQPPDERDFVLIGSQAVLGQFPHAPGALLVSIEADIYPRQAPAKSDLIDGAIGELSMFHQAFGYYAHGVDETTATLPACETLPARDFRRF